MTLHAVEVESLKKAQKGVCRKAPICEFVATLTLREFYALFYGYRTFQKEITSHALSGVLCEHCAPIIGNSGKLLTTSPSASTTQNDLTSAMEKYADFQKQPA
jgi:hypothetical protein